MLSAENHLKYKLLNLIIMCTIHSIQAAPTSGEMFYVKNRHHLAICINYLVKRVSSQHLKYIFQPRQTIINLLILSVSLRVMNCRTVKYRDLKDLD